jgi:DNA-binding transcriptional LysR family regulator
MHRRHEYMNMPIEIVRTVVAVSETGSLTKAGETLNISQPAVSAQIKRIQTWLGGELFRKTPHGTVATALGKLVLHEARKMLEANDQMFRLGGAAGRSPVLRLGISTPFAEPFLDNETAETLSDIILHTDNSLGITKGLIDGYIDIACFFENAEMDPDMRCVIVKQREEPLAWVRSKDFVLGPGAPIPLLTWPGDEIAISALRKNGNAYKIVFNSPDYHAKIAALKKGIGLGSLPRCAIPASLVEAREDYLPALAPQKVLLCTRSDLNDPNAKKLLTRLSDLFFRAA